jgi:hypothetical protein
MALDIVRHSVLNVKTKLFLALAGRCVTAFSTSTACPTHQFASYRSHTWPMDLPACDSFLSSRSPCVSERTTPAKTGANLWLARHRGFATRAALVERSIFQSRRRIQGCSSAKFCFGRQAGTGPCRCWLGRQILEVGRHCGDYAAITAFRSELCCPGRAWTRVSR